MGRLVGYSLVSKDYFIWVPKLRQVVESRDVLFYEQFGPNRIPGLSPYNGTPYLDDIPPAINSDMLDEAGNSLHPLLPPIVENCPGKMVLRPRPGAECAVSSVVAKGGRESSVLTDINFPESLGVAGTSTPPCNAGEVGGVRTSYIMVESLFDPQPVSAYHPCTSTDTLKALLASA